MNLNRIILFVLLAAFVQEPALANPDVAYAANNPGRVLPGNSSHEPSGSKPTQPDTPSTGLSTPRSSDNLIVFSPSELSLRNKLHYGLLPSTTDSPVSPTNQPFPANSSSSEPQKFAENDSVGGGITYCSSGQQCQTEPGRIRQRRGIFNIFASVANQAVKSVAKKIEKKAQELGNTIEREAGKFKNTVQRKTQELESTLKKAAQGAVKSVVQPVVEDVKRQAAEEVKVHIEKAQTAANTTVDTAIAKAKEQADEVVEKARGVANSVVLGVTIAALTLSAVIIPFLVMKFF